MGYKNAKGTRGTTRNVLNYADQRRLEAWVQEHYAALKLPDTDSAKRASEELGLPVTEHSLRFIRQFLQIPSNYVRVPKPKTVIESTGTDPRVDRLVEVVTELSRSASRQVETNSETAMTLDTVSDAIKTQAKTLSEVVKRLDGQSMLSREAGDNLRRESEARVAVANRVSELAKENAELRKILSELNGQLGVIRLAMKHNNVKV